MCSSKFYHNAIKKVFPLYPPPFSDDLEREWKSEGIFPKKVSRNKYAKFLEDPKTGSALKIKGTESAIFFWSYHYYIRSHLHTSRESPGLNSNIEENVPSEGAEPNKYAKFYKPESTGSLSQIEEREFKDEDVSFLKPILAIFFV